MKRIVVVIAFLAVHVSLFAQSSQDTRHVADSCFRKGSILFQMESFNQACPCFEKASRLYHQSGLIKEECDALYYVGASNSFMCNYEEALDAYRQSEILASSIHDEARLMEVYFEQYQIRKERAEKGAEKKILSRIDSLYSISDNKEVEFLYNMHWGKVEVSYEEYDLAERWYKKNEPLLEFVGKYKCTYYSNLRNLYKKWGKLELALRYAYLTRDEAQIEDERLTSNYFVTDIYKELRDSTSCFRTFDTLANVVIALDNPRELARFYQSRGMCYQSFNDYEKALADFKKADAILSSICGLGDPDRVQLLSLIGGAEYHLGHYEKSVQCYEIHAEGVKRLHGENHPDYVDAMDYLANAEAFAGHIEDACRDFATVAEILRTQVRENLPYLASEERDHYWKDAYSRFCRMTPFALAAEEYQDYPSSFTQASYDALVLSKAFLLASERSTRDLIKEFGTDEDVILYEQISAIQGKINKWQRDEVNNIDSIGLYKTKKNQLETKLANRCRVFGDMTAFMDIDYDEIRENLEDGDVLIDFTDYVSQSKGRIYAAYVVNNSQEYPLLMKLFHESIISSMQVQFQYLYFDERLPWAKEIRRLAWEPFEDYVNEGSTVYYVPSQMLYGIPLESLPADDGKTLGEHYHFVRLSSSREIVDLDEKYKMGFLADGFNVVLYGGLKYDLDTAVMAEEARKYDVVPLLASVEDVPRGGKDLKELPGTLREVNGIEGLLRAHGVSVNTFSGARGTEESFYSLSGKSAPQILHLATHGFYYAPDKAMEVDGLKGYKDAMMLSGLVMAGGNAEWRGKDVPDGVMGGILTAADIARLDLSRTELVVLSACHSGDGKATDEGLYGLQRAFKKAGAKKMIVSLWEVSDAAGDDFVTCFFEKLLDGETKGDIRKSFESAKSYIRDTYRDPYYWAGFVLIE